MKTPITKNLITIPQGSTYNDTVTIRQADGVTPLNLTGYTVRSQLRDLFGALSAEFVCTIATPASGVIARTLPVSVTALLSPLPGINHIWGIELTAPSGAVLPEIQGGALVPGEVVV